MKIEIGKRYKNRNGEIVGPMIESCYPLADHLGTGYAANGRYYAADDGGENEKDLVEEYIEPTIIETWGVVDTEKRTVLGSFDVLNHASAFATAMRDSGWDCKIIKLAGELK